MISATFTSMILAKYEAKLSIIASGVLYAFVPMLMGTAGNAGNQTSVTIIRALALGDINFKDVFKVILKELLASFLIGLTVSVVCFLKLYFIDNLYSDITLEVSAIVSGVLLITIMMAKLVGCLLPLVAKKIKLDPAVVASPFMTTIVDVLSLIIYCSIAIAILV
jgi:magnesium transporter